MTLTEHKIIATVDAVADDAALSKLVDDVSDALEMGLQAVLESVRAKFPNVSFMVVD